MDWETLLAITGLYLLLLGNSIHHYVFSRKIIEISKENQRILSLIEAVLEGRARK